MWLSRKSVTYHQKGKPRCPEIGPNTASPEKRHKVVKKKTNRLKMPPSQPVFFVRETLTYPRFISTSKNNGWLAFGEKRLITSERLKLFYLKDLLF